MAIPLPPRPNNRRIQTTELDFDPIKENFKEYLRGQTEYSDYDFEGSGLSILLDVLAYNTHYNALYTNLALNESFIDSASKRDSIVSKAKELGYTPQSAKSATAIVNLTFINNEVTAPNSYSIGTYTPFNVVMDGTTYTFVTIESYIAYRQNNQYTFNNIILKEGVALQYKFVVTTPTTQIVIPNPNVDLSTIKVSVQENAQSSRIRNFALSNTVLNINENSEVFFVKETNNQLFQLEFGNNSIGKALDVGNIVIIDYIVCNQDAPNGARSFAYNGTLATNVRSITTTVTPAFGGSPPEDIESIRWNAPRAFTAQNRCVTLDDYKAIIHSLYPNAQSVNVWGGEENVPPSYGDVFISVKTITGETLLQNEQDYILNDIIGPRKVVTIHPKFVDPTYIGVDLDVSFYYDPKLTSKTAKEISLIVNQTINDYNNTNLNQFGGILKYSVLSRLIDSSELSITNSITTLRLRRSVLPVFNQSYKYIVDIGNPIYNPEGGERSLYSSELSVLNTALPVFFEDQSTVGSDLGTIKMYYMNQGNKIFVKDVGIVTYSKGLIEINDIIITGTDLATFEFVIKPQSYDVASIRNQIVNIIPDMVKITPKLVSEANSYKFTPSRD